MNILFSTKDIEKMLFSSFSDIVPDKEDLDWMFDAQDKSLPDVTSPYSYRLLDESYGQFAYSKISETLVISLGMRKKISKKQSYGQTINVNLYGNIIMMFHYTREDDGTGFWHNPFNLVVDDLLETGSTLTEENIRKVMTDTRKYMRQLLPLIDFPEKLEKKLSELKFGSA